MEKKLILGATYKVIFTDNTERIFTFEGGKVPMIRFEEDGAAVLYAS